ncbi:MAG: DUF4149 domain-containing protein [Myxococcales bacterium]|nr:DUF4149 domain-containing protein [Myxococcales bacterium]MDH5565355.1 DUF4149 domain-containing protein [Myxococcales bacterium]
MDAQRNPSDLPEVQRLASSRAQTPLRLLLWLTLGAWIGVWLLFGLVVAPTAFRVLPSPHLAGSLVGPVLESLQLFGAAAGLGLAAIAAWLRCGLLQRLLPLGMGLVCLYSQFGLSAEIAEIQNGAFGPQGSEALATRFNQLHRLSVGLFVAVGIGALTLAALHARDEARREG